MITLEEFSRLGFEDRGMNGYSRLIPCKHGDPVEIYVDHDGIVSLCQSNNEDHVVITSRTYEDVDSLEQLLVAMRTSL